MNDMKGKVLLGLGIFVLVTMITSLTYAANEIVLGAVYPFTGNLAVQGNAAFNGADIAREMVNEKGGVLGSKIVFEKVDAPNPSAATNETQRFITQKKVKLIVGSYSSSISLAASAVAERSKVVWAEMGGMSNDITNRGFKYTFRVTANTGQVGLGTADFLTGRIVPALNKPAKEIKVALIHEDSAFGTGVMDAFQKKAKELGFPIVVAEPYSAKMTDLAPLVLKLKAAAPDVLVATQYLNDEILFCKQAKELGFNVKAFIGTGGTVGMKDFRNAIGNEANGIIEVDQPSADINSAGLKPDQAALLKEFLKRYKARTGDDQPPSPAMGGFFATTLLLTQVLPKAGGFDPDKIRNAYMGLDIPVGGMVNGMGVKLGPDGQNERTLMIARQWQGDRFVVVSPEKWATASMCCTPLKPWGER